MFKLGLIKDAIKPYESKVSHVELEKVLQEIGKKYGIEIRNCGNDVVGFIPFYTESKQENWYEEYSKELEIVLKEKYS
ncbi:hypothetical protein HZA33_05315 [Candidatus Pacearchaeota archaeon]|nr:hypothetical protein [Candidatus Pacearchaeota archaeon]